MILKEILRKRKNKILLFAAACIIVFIAVFNFPLLHTDYQKNQLKSEEFFAVSGKWNVTKYLGEYVEYHGAEDKTKIQQERENKIILETKKKYLGKTLVIEKQNIVSFFPPFEKGYYCYNWEELYSLYRQDPFITPDIIPPYLCVSFRLKQYRDNLDIIVDRNDKAMLVVKGSFFMIERIEN